MKKIDVLPGLIQTLIDQKQHLVGSWMGLSHVSHILGKRHIDKDQFTKAFANGMYEFYLDMIRTKGERSVPCRVRDELLRFLDEHHISAKDLFVVYTGLKDTLVDFFLTDERILLRLHQDPLYLHKLFTETAEIVNDNFSKLIHEYTQSVFERQEELGRYSKLIEEHVMLSRTDKFGRITQVSDSFCEVSEYTRDELIGKPHNVVRSPDVPREVFKDMWDTIQAGEIWEGKIKNRKKNNGFFIAHTTVMPVKDSHGEITAYVSIRHDITDKINATVDSLTKAYNRRKFEAEYAELYLKSVEMDRKLSLIVLDVDNFKMINDTYGHLKGDEVLVRIAEAVKAHIRSNDIFARWGGEEFVILMEGASIQITVEKAEAIRGEIAAIAFENIGQVTCSFGVAQLREDEGKEDLIKRADDFLYRAKREGKNRVIYE